MFCCLWRNVEASCHKHFVVFSRNQHRRLLPAMCHNLRHAAPPATALTTPACCSVNTGSQARYRLRIAISAYPVLTVGRVAKNHHWQVRLLNAAARVVSNTGKFDRGCLCILLCNSNCVLTVSTNKRIWWWWLDTSAPLRAALARCFAANPP